jgi:hypothetical protein
VAITNAPNEKPDCMLVHMIKEQLEGSKAPQKELFKDLLGNHEQAPLYV